MAFKGGSNQACAACKYQRRRCHPDCPLAPYFPSDKPKAFQNAHKLFGVSNIMKILKQVRDDQKDEAMKSIIYEADMRQRFPVQGCLFVTLQLRDQLFHAQEELHRVNSLLAVLRNAEHSHAQFRPENNNDSNHVIPPFSTEDDGVESNDIKPAFWVQPPNNSYIGNNYNNLLLGNNYSNLSLGGKSQIMHEIEIPPDYYNDMAYNSIVDERRSYKLQEARESSNEYTLNEAMKSMDVVSQNNELKIAAACFSLKSVQLGKTVSR